LPGIDAVAALRHVRTTDLKQLWVPDCLRHEDQLIQAEELLAAASERLDGQASFDPVVEVDVPKSAFFTRSGVLLTLEDRVAYHAAVLTFVDRVEQLLSPAVFSARRSPDADFLLKKGWDQWVRWKDAVVAKLKEGQQWMVKTDITAYFDNIQHRVLYSQVDSLNPEPRVGQALKKMLSEWSPVPGVGIPQGPDASRVLGNLYLTPVDQAMAQGNWTYVRYQDDIRITAATRSEAVAALHVLERECKKLGLSLSAKKTELLFGDAAIADFEDEELKDAQYWMRFGFGAGLRKRLRRIIKKAIRADGGVDERRARFSLWRLALLRDHYPLTTVLKRLENFASLASIVATYLRPWISRKRVERGLTEFLGDEDRNTSTFLSAWLMAVMLDRRGPIPWGGIAYARSVAQNRNQPPYHRVLAANVLARGGSAPDLAWLQRQISIEFDPTFVRGCLVALARVGALDRGTAGRAEARFPELGKTMAYLRGRATLPSLVFAELSVRVERGAVAD
jgi:hypothetical protein